MNLVPGSSKNSWQPVMSADTTNPMYWLNWRVPFCVILVLISMAFASFLIWKYEGTNTEGSDITENNKESARPLYDEEAWMPCLKEIHPAWLLGFRVIAFLMLTTLLIINVAVDGNSIYYYYTQWTFTLVTIYFGLGSLLSTYGCYQLKKVSDDKDDISDLDAERGTYVSPTQRGKANISSRRKNMDSRAENSARKHAGVLVYVFQIIFQMSGGAVMLTDCVFWFIIVPFLSVRDYGLNLLLIGMHSVNAIFLLGDAVLNCLHFPWFRIAYFVLWTDIYVSFQWMIHACIQIWWPYPFLDLSSSYAPIWYLLVGLMHIPCYAIFALGIKGKHLILSRWFPHSYQ